MSEPPVVRLNYVEPSVAAIEATREAVLSAGGKLVRDVHDFPGGRRFEFTDPDGNELAVWQRG